MYRQYSYPQQQQKRSHYRRRRRCSDWMRSVNTDSCFWMSIGFWISFILCATTHRANVLSDMMTTRHQQQQQKNEPCVDTGMKKIAAAAAITQRPWLTIGIPTVSRHGGSETTNYLNQTLYSIYSQQLSAASSSSPQQLLSYNVVVMNNNPRNRSHTQFVQAKHHYAATAGVVVETPGICIHFVDNPYNYTDPPDTRKSDFESANVPGPLVRKQTRDIAALLQYVATSQSAMAEEEEEVTAPKLFLLVEDDFPMCPRALLDLEHAVATANQQYPGWFAMRVSHGLNGILLHTSDLQKFQRYLLKHQIRRPPDHLAVEWFTGETDESATDKQQRPHLTYRFDLFRHIGKVSSLQHGGSSDVHAKPDSCHQQLVYSRLFKIEAFDLVRCPNSFICDH